MRPLRDDEVDRLQVEAQQCVKLRSTNRSTSTTTKRVKLFIRSSPSVEARITIVVRVHLVVLPAGSHLFPSRTQQLSPSGPMVAARQE
ncbi:MAG: hypothetical protein ACD_76C00147G0001 [uncultured bacterium]|nr:MAG: hypothetical protein ACD_76C00147G0001 [uncultured bacterium]